MPDMEAAFAREAERIGAATAARAVGGGDRLVVAGHRIVRLVGRGGMGVVYEAVEEALGPHRRAEARRAGAGGRARLSRALHRRVAARGVDRPSERAAGVRGRRARRDAVSRDAVRRRRGPALARRAARRRGRRAIVAQVGAALDAAHARRLVHRDVKPGNVLVGGGDHAYLTDFGLVKALDASAGADPHRRAGRDARLRRAGADPRRAGAARRATCTRSAACCSTR